MRFSSLCAQVRLTHAAGPEAVEYDGVYAGDLLSRAMSRVREGNLWITIMNNINVIAVASLAEASAVILAEGVTLAEDARAAADEKGIAVYSSEESVYALCAQIASLRGE